MTERMEGGCACGAVRYESPVAPLFSIQCCCRQCQHITGGGHASQFALPVDRVAITGKLARYELTADSGNKVTSEFCPACGAPILKRSSGYPRFVFFHAATLDDPSRFAPQKVVWSAQRPSWDLVDPTLPAL